MCSRVQEPASEYSRGRKMVRPGVSQMADGTPSKVKTSYPRAGHDHWREEYTSQEASKPPDSNLSSPHAGEEEA